MQPYLQNSYLLAVMKVAVLFTTALCMGSRYVFVKNDAIQVTVFPHSYIHSIDSQYSQIIDHSVCTLECLLQSKLLPDSISSHPIFIIFLGVCLRPPSKSMLQLLHMLNMLHTLRNPMATLCTRLVGSSQLFLFQSIPSSKCILFSVWIHPSELHVECKLMLK